MSGPLLQATGVFKSYPAVKVLKNVDLTVGRGDTFAIIGPNGAGKTTLFKVLSGELFPDAGRVVHDGRDVTSMPAWQRVRLGFGRSFQVARVFSDLTTEENMIVSVEAHRRNSGSRPARSFAWAPTGDVRAAVTATLEEVGLADKRHEISRLLSHGDKKRLELAMSLALQPRILMLDEPTAGMSPADRKAATDLLASVKERHGMTIVLTEHDMDVVFGLATRVAVLHYGEIVAEGAPAAVRANPLVRDIYLGHGGAGASHA